MKIVSVMAALVWSISSGPCYGQELNKDVLGPVDAGILFVASEPTVQKELRLTAEDTASVNRIVKAYFSELVKTATENRNFRRKNRGENEKLEAANKEFFAAVGEINKKYKTELQECLVGEKLKRLMQITWQAYGSEILLTDSELTRSLLLTGEQIDRIKMINQEASRRGVDKALQGMQLWEMDQERDLKAKEVLTAEQQTTMAGLLGEPFDVKLLIYTRADRGRNKNQN